MALALYRKYRPATFAEVVGQEHVTDPLRTALAAGRINHAYLFSGPRGCGKTSSARILARSLNCVHGPTPEPCGECPSCIALAPEGPGSLDVVEMDAASHGGVDDTRELRDRAFYMPAESRYRIFIIDEAHMVSTQGFNALLKIVEEPPEHLVFIFATTEPEKVLTTIRSRTHHYPFRLIPPATLRALLERLCAEERVTVDPAVFSLVIRAGGGSARDSLSVLDQLLAGAGPGGVSYASAVALLGVTDAALLDEIVDALAAGDAASVFGAVDKVVEAGHDPRRFAADLLQRLRDLIVMGAVPGAGASGLIDVPEDELAAMTGQSDRLGAGTLSRLAEIVHAGLVDMRGTTAPRLVLELMCARMLLPAASTEDAALLQRLERMERRMAIAADHVGDPAAAGPEATPSREFPRRSSAPTEPATPTVGPASRSAEPAPSIPVPSTQPPAAPPSTAVPPTALPPTAVPPAPPPASSPAADPPAAEPDRTPPMRTNAVGGTSGRRADADAPARSVLGLPAPPTLSSDRPAPAERPVPDDPAAPEPIPTAILPGRDPAEEPPSPGPSAPTSPQDAVALDPAAHQVVTEPSSEKPATGTALDVTDVRRVWADVLVAVQKHRRTTQILLESATVVGVAGTTLTLSMPSAGMAKRVVEAGNADLLRAALREVLGVDWAIRCDAGEPGVQAASVGHTPAARTSAARTPAAPASGARTSVTRTSAPRSPAPGAPAADPAERPPAASGPTDLLVRAGVVSQGTAGQSAASAWPVPEPPDDDDEIPEDYGDPEAMAAPAGHHDPEEAAMTLLAAELGATRVAPDS